MKPSIGSRKVLELGLHHLTLQALPGASLGDEVKLIRDDGRQISGVVTALGVEGITVLTDSSLWGWSKEELTVWLEPERETARGDREQTVPPGRWYSGLPSWDTLFPTRRGDRVLVKAPDGGTALNWALDLARSAADQGLTPVYIGLNASPHSTRLAGRTWAETGLDDDDLILVEGTRSASDGLNTLHRAFEHSAKMAKAGLPVCLILRDLDSWFNLYAEVCTDQGHPCSLPAMVTGFHGAVLQAFDPLWSLGPAITVLAFLSDWTNRGRPSPLWGLRAYFDLALPLSGSGGITLEGDVTNPQADGTVAAATALRRQLKSLQRRALTLVARGESLKGPLADFRLKLERFLSSPRGTSDPPAPWELLRGFPRSDLDCLPDHLIRNHLTDLEEE